MVGDQQAIDSSHCKYFAYVFVFLSCSVVCRL